MLEDVFVRPHTYVVARGIMVITRDAAAAAIAHAAGALVVDDLEKTGTTRRVAQASRISPRQGAAAC
jgi:hypothetical protein